MLLCWKQWHGLSQPHNQFKEICTDVTCADNTVSVC